MLGFALCHGWAYDRGLVTPLANALRERFPHSEVAVFDLGFTGSPSIPPLDPGKPWIAVGHSYGFTYLMQQTMNWQAAVSINGFTRFCRRPGRPEGTPPRVVDAMLAKLQTDPRAVVQDFHARCGSVEPSPPALESALLLDHLRRLRDIDIGLPPCPLLALATEDDAIVPPALSRACFEHPGVSLRMNAGDHLEWLRQATNCAQAIAEFCEEQSCSTR